jgi:hypothetical protein
MPADVRPPYDVELEAALAAAGDRLAGPGTPWRAFRTVCITLRRSSSG